MPEQGFTCKLKLSFLQPTNQALTNPQNAQAAAELVAQLLTAAGYNAAVEAI